MGDCHNTESGDCTTYEHLRFTKEEIFNFSTKIKDTVLFNGLRKCSYKAERSIKFLKKKTFDLQKNASKLKILIDLQKVN